MWVNKIVEIVRSSPTSFENAVIAEDGLTSHMIILRSAPQGAGNEV